MMSHYDTLPHLAVNARMNDTLGIHRAVSQHQGVLLMGARTPRASTGQSTPKGFADTDRGKSGKGGDVKAPETVGSSKELEAWWLSGPALRWLLTHLLQGG